MASLTKNTLREIGIFNEHNLASLQDEPKVWVSFSSSGKGRDMTVGGWRVHRVGYTTGHDKYEDKIFINSLSIMVNKIKNRNVLTPLLGLLKNMGLSRGSVHHLVATMQKVLSLEQRRKYELPLLPRAYSLVRQRRHRR